MAINYSRVNWDTTKYVNPTNMNQMDKGIKDACDGVDNLGTEFDTVIGDTSVLPNPTHDICTNISEVNSKLTNIGKTCCYSQGNTGELRNAEIPMTVKLYSDDDIMYKPDSNGILITGAGTYLVQAHFHVLASANDEIRFFINQSLHTLFDGVSSQIEVIPNYSMQKQITLTKIVRFDDGAERVKMKFETNNGNSYVFPNNLTQNNRITITKIK